MSNLLRTREILEKEEFEDLSSFALKNAGSRGRNHKEKKDKFRLDFAVDRDRVLHSKSFRRLKGKTQVFVAHFGDHFRSRLTHTLEVAQIARTISRILGLNEELAETIALAHDLGHTPFGHSGEQALDEMMKKFGERYEHNVQSRRIVEKLEYKSHRFVGLNLTFETLEGLAKHPTEKEKVKYDLSRNPTLEAQIVDLADEIAYQSHDIEDGLNSKIITLEQLDKLGLWQRASSESNIKAPENFRIEKTISRIIEMLIEDLVLNVAKKVERYKIKSADDVRNSKFKIASFSPKIRKEGREMRKFLLTEFYSDHVVSNQMREGRKIIKRLFDFYFNDERKLPEDLVLRIAQGEKKEYVIRDYIAGMTDNYAIDESKKFGLIF